MKDQKESVPLRNSFTEYVQEKTVPRARADSYSGKAEASIQADVEDPPVGRPSVKTDLSDLYLQLEELSKEVTDLSCCLGPVLLLAYPEPCKGEEQESVVPPRCDLAKWILTASEKIQDIRRKLHSIRVCLNLE